MFSGFSRKTLLGLAFSLIVTNSVMADQRLYPTASQTPLVVGSEEFKANYASLAGLEGVHVITRYLWRSAKKHDITGMKSDLEEQIGKRLNTVGLRMLNRKEYETIPGQPTMTFYPSYTGDAADTSVLKTTAFNESSQVDTKQTQAHCRSSIWTSFLQSGTILRDPNKHFKFITWGAGEKSNDCENRGTWTYNAVLKVVDKFIADFKKAESEYESEVQLKTVTAANEVPEDCAQPWKINVRVFEVNKTRINDSVKPILDKFAKTASRCQQYRYLIKTHASSGADSNYNRILSEARAHAIKDYLLFRDVNHYRLETVAFGESIPLSEKNSKKDSVMPRVIITPQL